MWFEGTRREKRELRTALKYEPRHYPKRRRAKALIAPRMSVGAYEPEPLAALLHQFQ